jgi:uncharacterized protein (DUF1499 family)
MSYNVKELISNDVMYHGKIHDIEVDKTIENVVFSNSSGKNIMEMIKSAQCTIKIQYEDESVIKYQTSNIDEISYIDGIKFYFDNHKKVLHVMDRAL